MASPVMLTFGFGIAIRYWLADTQLSSSLSSMSELSTPLTSWMRVTEGLALHKAGISPYTGALFHQMPLVLRGLKVANNFFGENPYVIFLICDVLVALVLERIAQHYGRQLLKKQARDVKHYHPDATSLILKASDLHFSRLYVVAAYLLNPYTIASCLAKSTAVLDNLAIVLSIYFMVKGHRVRSGFMVAVAAYMSLYPIMLVVPLAMFIAQKEHGENLSERGALISMAWTCGVCVCVLLALLYVSFLLEGSWLFLHSTYGFILMVPDLSPNLGVFWYFFTEMFEHFRIFFICVFQINVFIYTVPLAIRLKDHAVFLSFSLVALTAIFKSYPSYADAALYLAMLPLWRHNTRYMRNNFVVACMFVVCTVLAPILWHLWIYAGSANANFYFAITLVYSTAQIFLVTDAIYAFLRWEYSVFNGPKPPMIDGKPAMVILD